MTGTAGSLAARFPAALVRELARTLSAEESAESAVPSYTHWNPAIRWLMFRRLELIRRMASEALAGIAARDRLLALDFGCGIGMLIPVVAPQVAELYLCDERLAPARATARLFAATNVVCLPPGEVGDRITDASLDVVIAADVLEHVDDLAAIVSTLGRKLRPGGTLIVSGPTEGRAYRLGRWIAGFSGDYHQRDVFAVEDALGRARLRRETVRRIPVPVAFALFRITSWRRIE